MTETGEQTHTTIGKARRTHYRQLACCQVSVCGNEDLTHADLCSDTKWCTAQNDYQMEKLASLNTCNTISTPNNIHANFLQPKKKKKKREREADFFVCANTPTR